MSELPGLPAFGPEPVFAADDAAYERVVGRAITRRRQRGAAAFSATAVATVAAVLLTSSGGYGTTSLEPADPPVKHPAATASDTPSPQNAPGATAEPSATAEPTEAPSREPRPEPTEVPTQSPTADSGAPREQWHEKSVVVNDGDPGGDCEVAGVREGWCFRYLGPASAKAGDQVAFTAELCRLPGGTEASRVDFEKNVELVVMLQAMDNDGDGQPDGDWANSTQWGYPSEHSRTVEAGQCIQWSQVWNGVGAEGAMEPGAYNLYVLVAGTTPRQPIPGEGDQSTTRTHGAFREFQLT